MQILVGIIVIFLYDIVIILNGILIFHFHIFFKENHKRSSLIIVIITIFIVNVTNWVRYFVIITMVIIITLVILL